MIKLDPNQVRLLKAAEVCEIVGLSRQHIYRMIALGQFPRAIPLSKRARGWRSDEIDAWIEGRTIARDAG